MDTPDPDDFRSVSALLGELTTDELRIMHDELEALQQSRGWAHLSRLLLLERETQVRRMMSSAVLEHAQYAHKAGMVHGLASPWALMEKVHTTHRRVQAQLAAEIQQDGE